MIDAGPTERRRPDVGLVPARVSRPGSAAGLGGVLAAISPFDLGVPSEGWTPLFLRPLLLVTAVIAIAMLAVSRSSIDRPLAGAIVALTAGFAVASIVSVDPAVGFAVTIRVAVLGLVFLAAAAAFARPAGRRSLVIGVAVGAGTASAIGLIVLAAGGDRFGSDLLLGSISVTRGISRLTRPFSHANVAAMYLAPAAILVGSAAGRTSDSTAGSTSDSTAGSTVDGAAGLDVAVGRRGRVALASVAGLAAVALSLTLSRSGVVALVVSALVVVAAPAVLPLAKVGVRTRDRALPLALVGLVVGTGVLSGRWPARLDLSSSAGGGPRLLTRPEIWSQAVDAWVSRPLVGIGPGRFGAYSRSVTPVSEAAAAHAHNPLLEAAATGGLVALAGVLVFAAVVIRRVRPGLVAIPLGLSAALVAAMLPMVADDPFLFSSSGNLAALVGGAWYAAGRQARR